MRFRLRPSGGRWLLSQLQRATRDTRGVAAVEMALATPLLLTFFCGVAEMSHLLTVHYQAAQMASTVSDVVARYEAVTDDEIGPIFAASASVMGTADFATKGYVILSSVAKNGANQAPKIAWQCEGGGLLKNESRIGEVGKAAALPGGLTLSADDNVIVAEIFFQYSAYFDLVPIPEKLVYKTATFRPRLGALTTAPGC